MCQPLAGPAAPRDMTSVARQCDGTNFLSFSTAMSHEVSETSWREGQQADPFLRKEIFTRRKGGISFNSSLTSNRDFYGTVIGNHGISSSPTLLSRPPDPLYWRFYWKGRVNLGIEENGSSFQSDKYIIIS